MNKIVLSIILSLLTASVLYSQEEVRWYTIEEADALLKENPKPLFIDAYTDWCGWCKKLDKDTFSDPVIAAYLNKHFIPVKFDAESKEPLTFLGREFVNNGEYGRAHELAVALMQGKMSYPTVIFLSDKGELLSPVPGYKTPAQIEPILVFFGEEKYLTEKWEDFSKNFQGSFE